MTPELYALLMVGVIALVGVVVVPALLRKRCGGCGTRNPLDATMCSACRRPFPEDS